MKISRQSWHYRYLRDAFISFKDVPAELCPYVRHLVLQFVAQCVVYGSILWVLSAPVWLWIGDTDVWWQLVSMILFGGIVLTIAMLVVVFAWIEHIWPWITRKTAQLFDYAFDRVDAYNDAVVAEGRTPVTERSKTWWRAIHGRICPKVEWTS